MAPGEAFLAFHFPDVAANLLTSDVVDDATSCPEYKVTAVSIRPVARSVSSSRPAETLQARSP
jgi:formate dehydrogenase major subunit